MSHFHKTGEEVECLTCNPSLGGGGFRAIRDVLSQTGDAAVKHEQQALDLAKAGKVDVKDFESRLSLYQQHKPYRIAAKH